MITIDDSTRFEDRDNRICNRSSSSRLSRSNSRSADARSVQLDGVREVAHGFVEITRSISPTDLAGFASTQELQSGQKDKETESSKSECHTRKNRSSDTGTSNANSGKLGSEKTGQDRSCSNVKILSGSVSHRGRKNSPRSESSGRSNSRSASRTRSSSHKRSKSRARSKDRASSQSSHVRSVSRSCSRSNHKRSTPPDDKPLESPQLSVIKSTSSHSTSRNRRTSCGLGLTNRRSSLRRDRPGECKPSVNRSNDNDDSDIDDDENANLGNYCIQFDCNKEKNPGKVSGGLVRSRSFDTQSLSVSRSDHNVSYSSTKARIARSRSMELSPLEALSLHHPNSMSSNSASMRSSRTHRLRRIERNVEIGLQELRSSLHQECADSSVTWNDDDEQSTSLLHASSSLIQPPLTTGESSQNDQNHGNRSRSNSVDLVHVAIEREQQCRRSIARTKSSGRCLKEATRARFFGILDLDPFKSEVIANEDRKQLIQIMREFPQLCAEPYKSFRMFPNDSILPLHMLCALGAPISLVRHCLKAYPKALQDNSTSQLGTPFHFVCMFHHVNHHVVSNDDEDEHGGASTIALIKYLSKVKPAGLTVHNELNQQTPLHIACMAFYTEKSCRTSDEKKAEIVHYILQVCPILATVLDKNMNSPLHVACAATQSAGGVFIAKRLLMNISDTMVCCTTQNKDGATPLHLALYNKAPVALIQLLVHTNSGALWLQDSKNRLPIHIAAFVKLRNVMMYETLIEANPESLYCTTKLNETPYQIALGNKLNDTILELLKC